MPAWGIRSLLSLLAIFFSVIAGGKSSQASDVILGVQPIPATSGSLSAPVYLTSAPGDPTGMYVVEQFASRVKRFDISTGAITTFLDLPDIGGTIGERGLKGMTFHPDYLNNGKLYVHEFDGVNVNILEFTRDFNQSNVSAATERSILTFNHINIDANHTAGWIGFSPIDGYMYIPTGDGGPGGCGTCGLPAQNLNDLRGKVLRIDVDGDDFPMDSNQNYAIPTDNPFFGEVDKRGEVFAYGLRHPWRAGFDSLTGDLYVGDVGSQYYEEINLIPAGSGGGQNFGWRAVEGPADMPQFPDPKPANAVEPLYYYANGTGAAVVAGPVYRGSEIPGFEGQYIFADFVKQEIYTFDPTGGVATDFVDRTAETAPGIGLRYTQLAAFGEDNAGEVYFIRRGFSTLYKLIGFASADFNRDGRVDGDDLVQWQEDYGLNGDSDADRDGDSDGRDFLIWQRQFGLGIPLVAPTTVPEPSSLLMILACASAAMIHRRCV